MEKIKILAVGDAFLDAAALTEIIGPGLPDAVALETVQWDTGGKKGLQQFNLMFEQGGPGVIEPPAALAGRLPHADILFTQFCPVSAAALGMAARLRLIAVGRSGVENVDVAAATARGIGVVNTVGRNAQAVAEYMIGLLLCEARNIARGHEALKRGEWRKKYANDEMTPELPGKTLGLIGLGQIGRMVVRKLVGFELRVIAYDPYADPGACAALGVELVELPELMRQADFVSAHAKLTPETRHLVNAEMLALMKPTAYLINTARAELVDEAALAAALRGGRLAGAALDVFMTEPLPADHPLAALDNVTLSPHQGGVTADAYRTTAKMFLENIGRLWRGDEPPRNLVNREVEAKVRAFKAAVAGRVGG